MSAWNDADNDAIAALASQTQAFEGQGDFGDDDEDDRLFDNVEMLNGEVIGPEFEDEDEDAENEEANGHAEDEEADGNAEDEEAAENAESAGVSWQTVGEWFSKPLNGRPLMQGRRYRGRGSRCRRRRLQDAVGLN